MDNTNQSMNDKMNDMLQQVHVDREKELLKQEKAKTTQTKVQTELFEQASKLSDQTGAANNVATLLAVAKELHEHEWADERLAKQSLLLLKDAMKRARNSYK